MPAFDFYRSVAKAGAALLAALVIACPALAADLNETKNFDIKPQSLNRALVDFSKQAGFQVVADSAGVEKLQTRGVAGTHKVNSALEELLAGSGLSYRVIEPNVIVVEKAQTKPGVPGGASQAGPILAQAGSGSRDVYKAESITVTATKREERLIDVPSSIAVVTKDDIDRRGLVGAADYIRGIPGASQLEAEGQSIVIRGMETSPINQNFSSGPTTATYFGETPTTNSAGLGGGTHIDLKLVDIERVEVLRGPQGTAFGNSAMGGAVRTIPVAPKLDRFEGKVSGGYSVTAENGGDNYNAQAVLNIPVIKDTFAIRGVAYRYQDSGFYRNRAGSDPAFRTLIAPFGGVPFAADDDNVGSYYVNGGRIAALFQPSNDLRFTLSFLSQKTETDGWGHATSGTYEQTFLQSPPEHLVDGRKQGFWDTSIDIANIVMEYNLGWANLLGTYSYTKSGSEQVTPYQLFGRVWPVSYRSPSHHRARVGEIRLVSQLDGAWNFLAGLYTEELKDDVLFNYVWFGDPATAGVICAACVGLRSLETSMSRWKLTQKAVFGEASWNFLRDFTLTGGVRAYDYERSLADTITGPFFGPPSSTGSAADASGRTFRANLSYKPSENGLFYAGWAQGFRLGKPQAGLPLGRCDVNGDGIVDGAGITIESTKLIQSDEVDSYELGTKLSLLDRRITIDTAVFRMDWSGMPIRVLAPPPCGLAYNANAGSARSEGVEFQASYQVNKAFRVDLGGSWIHARLTEDVPLQGLRSGDRLPGSPKVNANLSLQYEFEIGGYKAFARADSIYVGTYYGNVQQSPSLKSGGYAKLDISTRVAVGKLNIDLFVRNLTNENAFVIRNYPASSIRPLIAEDLFGYRLRPRTIGLQLGYNF